MTEPRHSGSALLLNSSLTKGLPKMSKLKNLSAAFGLALAVCIIAPVASAQDILVVDTSRVLKESKAGQDLTGKVRQIGEAMQAELQPEQNALKTEKAALDAKLQGKTNDQVRADQALVSQGQAYTRKVQTFAEKSDKRSKELVATERTALNTFAQKLATAVDKVRAKRNGKIVLTSADIYMADASVEISSEVIAQLDIDAPTIPVTRVSLPDQPAPQR